MLHAKLGKNGPAMPRIGYGAMVLEGFYGEIDESSALNTLAYAMDKGLMIDTADAYGAGHNEGLIARALSRRSDTPFIASKFGIVYDENQEGRAFQTGWGFSLQVNGSAEYANKCLDATLSRLQRDVLDLWYLHYPDPATDIEITVEAMAQAVKAGKVRYLGLSNLSADLVRRAHAAHPISAVQYEYSLWRREAEAELLPTLRELGIALVAWSPLGAGFLAGKTDTLAEGDFRHNIPKYQAEHVEQNRQRMADLENIATRLGITTAQLSLAWLLAQGDDIFLIPGSRKTTRIDENLQAAAMSLSDDILQQVDELTKPGSFSGGSLLT